MTAPEPIEPQFAQPTSYCWFRLGASRFAVRTAELVGVATLTALRPLPLVDPGLAGFGFYRGQVLPVFDPVSLAGVSLERAFQSIRVAVITVENRLTLAFLCTEIGSTIDLSDTELAPTIGRLPDAFLGEQPFGENSLIVLDPPGLAQSVGLLSSESSRPSS